MKVSTFLGSIACATAIAYSGVASATVSTVNFSGYDKPFSTESRTEKINFSYTGGNFNLTGILDPVFTVINGVNTGLFQGATLVSDVDDTFQWAPTFLDLTRFTFSVSNLAAGNYTLKFNLLGGGFYSGSYTITPVPEPENNALIFAGLGIIALIARRKFS